MKFDWTIWLLALLCIMYSVFCACFLQLDTSVISSTWNWSIGSGPSNRERAKLEVLLSGISCQPSTSFNYNYISATASKGQFSWSLGKSVTNTASRAKLCTIWTSYDWWILFIYLPLYLPPTTVLLSKKEDTLKKNCSARHLSLFSSSSLGLTFASCSIALRLVSFLIRSIAWWKNSQLFPNVFHAIECVEQGGSLRKRGNILDNSDPDGSGLVKAPQTATLGVWEEWFECCACVPQVLQMPGDTASDHLRCWLWLCQRQPPLAGFAQYTKEGGSNCSLNSLKCLKH